MPESSGSRPRKKFGLFDFLWRWAAALLLVLLTYNPSGHSYVHWVREAVVEGALGALHFFVGVILIAGWTAFLVATKNSLGSLGVLIGAALVGTTIWLLVDVGLIHADSAREVIWLALIAVGTLLAIGMSWAHVWRRFSGQLEVDDND